MNRAIFCLVPVLNSEPHSDQPPHMGLILMLKPGQSQLTPTKWLFYSINTGNALQSVYIPT
jgi:hypothetical protein